jgi:N-acetylneuraminic acid mutarotase
VNPVVGRPSVLLKALIVVMATLAVAVPTAAGAAAIPQSKATSLSSIRQHPTHHVCAKPSRAGHMSCKAVVRDDATGPKGVQPNLAPAGFGPTDLQSAYNLPSGGAGQTVAIVDAFDNPTAESDLAVYRQQYGLPPCTTANGCFTKIDQRGGTSYPAPDDGWAGEMALDVDMVSAICPSCKILLVEADDNSSANLGTAVNQAVAQGAKYVSNSYGGDAGSGDTQSDDAYYHHPGVAITASSGDYGYGVEYPAASPYVTAVGGTSLVKDTTSVRGWSEAAWNGAGSGCSGFETKPSFQTDSGCSRRTVADVSAVADPNTGVAVYFGGWHIFGGTSVSAPIMASVYALAGEPAAGSMPNSAPYQHQHTSDLNDVTSGSNGSCNPAYLCTAGPGYDGPTGLGTPNGTGAFRTGPSGTVSGTVTDGTNPLTQAKVQVGATTTTTDGKGQYSLYVPTGTYDVTASKFGYVSKTVSGVTVGLSQTVTENFALTAKPSVKVTGTVRDGSGHGYPLYATVQVRGEPTTLTYTDPKTGRYSLNVPPGTTYPLQVDALYPGYTQSLADVVVGSADVTNDVKVAVDDSTCSAAGYAYHSQGTTQAFESSTVPAGWTVNDKIGNGQTWTFDNMFDFQNQTGGSGDFTMVPSGIDGTDSSQDTSLMSPVTDFSGVFHPVLSFQSDYFAGRSTSVADVDLSVDGGQTWSNVWHRTTSARGPRAESVKLPEAAGKSAVQIRFHYTATWDYWWEVDDVFLGDRSCDPTPGGLVVGRVLDKNTGAAVNGASITSAGQPAVKTTSAPTPDDPNVNGGFYWLFSAAGSHAFNATAGAYTAQNITVNVAADSVTQAAFSLPAPRIAVTPGSVSQTAAWQGQASQTVTVKNTGTAPLVAKIGERSGVYQPAAQGAPLREVTGHYSPGRIQPGKPGTNPATPAATPAAPPWTTTADYPEPLMDHGAATIDGKVYVVGGIDANGATDKGYVYDPGTQAWTAIANLPEAREAPEVAAVNGRLYVFGGWPNSGGAVAKPAIFDPVSGTWTTGADDPKPVAGAAVSVLGGKIYLVGGCDDACGRSDVQVYDTATNSWSTAHTYPENTSWLGCAGIVDRVYCAGGNSGTASSQHTYAYDPSSDSWAPVADLPIDLWGMSYSSAGGQLIVSDGVTAGSSKLTNQGFAYNPDTDSWTALPNSNNTVYRAAGACGFYKIGGSSGGLFQMQNSTEMLPGYDQCDGAADVPWLAESQTQVTLQPGASVNITVSLNAAKITQPGTYAAQLTISGKTPYGGAVVPVTFVVNPPKTWGKITGTVTGVICAGSSAPLAGATVQVDAGTASYTLRTDKNGQYVLWLDTRNNPLTLIVAKDGWAPQTRTVKIVKLKTTTANFTLKSSNVCS